MHAVVVVDHVHAVGVDRQRAPPALRAVGLSQGAVHAVLEGRSIQQSGQGVVTAGDDRGDALREQLGKPCLAHREFGHGERPEQRQYADRSLVGTRDRARQHAVGLALVACLELHLVDDHGLAADLRRRHQVAVRARHQAGVDGVLGVPAHHHQALVRDDDRGQAALDALNRGAQDRLELVAAAVFAAGIAGADRQQHVEVAILLCERAAEALDVFAVQQLARQYLQCRAHQRVHESNGSLFVLRAGLAAQQHRGVRLGRRGLVRAPQPENVDRFAVADHDAGRAGLIARRAHRFADHEDERRLDHHVAGPGELGPGIENGHAGQARQQRAQQARVGLEIGSACGRVRCGGVRDHGCVARRKHRAKPISQP